jgi:hypothetical protein
VALALFALFAIGSGKSKGGSGAAGTTGAIGTPLTVEEAEWLVLDVEDKGKTMKPSSEFGEEAKTDGRFIQVHFKIKNTGNKPGTLIELPKLTDSSNREFNPYDKQYSYLPKGAQQAILDTIQPSMQREYYEIFEVPADAKNLKLKIASFGLFAKNAHIDTKL